MTSASAVALTTGLLAAVLAVFALSRLRASHSAAFAVSYALASTLGTLFPLQLALLATALLAWSVRCGSAETGVGLAGLMLGVAGIIGFCVFIARHFASREILDKALQQALGVSADCDPPVQPRLWHLLRPLDCRRKDVERICDLSYGPAGVRNLLDVYRPRDLATGKAMPVLLQVHGSAWMVGSKDHQALPLIYLMAASGWLVVSINYRLSPAARFPAHLEDVNLAIAWVRNNIARYGGDPDFISITGGSAGGHLASLAALGATRREADAVLESTGLEIKAAVPIYGRYDFLGRDETPAMQNAFVNFLTRYIMPAPPETLPELWEQASPVSRVHARAPPFFVIHGSNDCIVPVEGARIFSERLRAVSKAAVVYAELPGLQHGFDIVRSPATEFMIHAVRRFLQAQHQLYLRATTMAATTPGGKS